MGYFKDEADLDDYVRKYCFFCKNWSDVIDSNKYGCPVIDVHTLFSDTTNPSVKSSQNLLIPLLPDKTNGKCTLYEVIEKWGS